MWCSAEPAAHFSQAFWFVFVTVCCTVLLALHEPAWSHIILCSGVQHACIETFVCCSWSPRGTSYRKGGHFFSDQLPHAHDTSPTLHRSLQYLKHYGDRLYKVGPIPATNCSDELVSYTAKYMNQPFAVNETLTQSLYETVHQRRVAHPFQMPTNRTPAGETFYIRYGYRAAWEKRRVLRGGPSLPVTARQSVRGNGLLLTFSHSVTSGSEGPPVKGFRY